MPTKVALLVISLLLGTGVATLGLYFGTNVFERDPLAGMEAEPIAEPEVPEAGAVAVPEMAQLTVEREAEPVGVRRATAKEAVAGSFGKAEQANLAVAVMAAALVPRQAHLVPAHDPDFLSLEQASIVRPDKVKVWKTSYASADARRDPDSAEPAEAVAADAAVAARSGAERLSSLRQPVSLLQPGVAEVVNGADIAPSPPPGVRIWKPSSAVVGQAVAPEENSPALLPSPSYGLVAEPGAAAAVASAREPVTAEAPRAGRVAADRAVEPHRRAVLEWKTSPAALSPRALTAADAEGDLLPVRIAPARPAPVDAPEPAPQAATIAIETVDFEDPDRITIAGLTQPHAFVRVHLNEELLGETRSDSLGMWRASGTRTLGTGRHLARAEVFDEDTVRQASAEMRFERVQIVMAEEPPRVDTAPSAPLAVERGIADMSAAGPTAVHIERGDNLWHIAQAIYGEGRLYTEIYDVNRNQIRNPDLIYPGQVFTIPILERTN